ncbi:MAG: hypothetical protein HY039_03010, partial [Nitrospirae bacterium]|nr:hypothetical protein [Nitrospirota bacterium]
IPEKTSRTAIAVSTDAILLISSSSLRHVDPTIAPRFFPADRLPARFKPVNRYSLFVNRYSAALVAINH